MEQAGSHPITKVMLAAGMTQAHKRWSPCPLCGATRASSTDRRGALKPNGCKRGWYCVSCGAKGDGINLVSFKLFGTTYAKLQDERRLSVRTWLAGHGLCSDKPALDTGAPRRMGNKKKGTPALQEDPFSLDDMPPPGNPLQDYEAGEEDKGPTYPPTSEVEALWNACTRVTDIPFVREREWDLSRLVELDVVRFTPAPDAYDWPEWWPRGRARTWRLVSRAFSSVGVLSSLHARAVVPVEKGTPKTLWPKGFDAAGLVMADKAGLELLLGKGKPPGMVLVTEGLTDLVSVALKVSALPNGAVFSCTNGSFGALRDLVPNLSIWTNIYSATDADAPGETYSRQLATAFAPIPVKRLPIGAFKQPAKPAQPVAR